MRNLNDLKKLSVGIHVVVPRDLRARLKVVAARQETSIRRLATQALERLLAEAEAEVRDAGNARVVHQAGGKS